MGSRTNRSRCLFGVILLVLSVLLTYPSLSIANDRPGFMECELAYPVSFPDSVPVLGAPEFTTGNGFEGEVVIGTDGRVKDLYPSPSGDSLFVDRHIAYIKGIRFEPGRLQGHREEQVIPFRCWRSPSENVVHLTFPIDTARQVLDARLYFQAIRGNGVQPPKMIQFPSYFFRPPEEADSASGRHYMLVEIGLDATGRLSDMTVLHADSTAFTDQVLTAINWATFAPAMIDAVPQPSTGYVLLSLFPDVDYPTLPLGGPIDSLPLLDRLRVQFLPDTVGLMFLPIPARTFKDGVYSLPEGRLTVEDTIGAAISISATGMPTRCNAIGADKASGRALRAMMANLRFWPATDFTGLARPFEGLIRFEPVTSTKVRVRFTWLPGERFYPTR